MEFQPAVAEEPSPEPDITAPASNDMSGTGSDQADRISAPVPESDIAEIAATATDNVIDLVEQRGGAMSATAEQEVAAPEQDRRKKPRIQREQVRVRADLLDNLVNFAGEVSIYRSRMEQQTNTFRYNLRELDETVSRLRHQLREFEIETESQMQYRREEAYGQSYEEFDPLEFDRFTHMQQLSRGMMESLNDLDSLRTILSNITRESETLLLQQSRVNTELQEGLMRTRMVPFSGVAPRLRRIVRQVSSELGKQVDLQLHGIDGELDRTVLDRIIPPLEHMLRNAVAHGIELPAQRKAAGKPETGRIELHFEQEGADIIIRVADDGAGINLDAIQRKAVEKGLLQPGTKVSREVLLNMIMESGFSTAEQVTQIAGRGVGMDVVNNEIKKIGGLLNIDTEAGKGTTFTISLPLTLAISRALMVNVGEETYAIPLLSVQAVERISGAELHALQEMENPSYVWLDEDYPLMHLGSVLGVSQPPVTPPDAKVSLLLVRSGEQRAAIMVEDLLGSREIVVKAVGPQISTLRGITGATIMGDGQVVLIVDLGVLIRLVASIEGEEVLEVTVPEVEKEQRPLVMVVDDSITVRKVTGRLLERNDYDVITAKDGVDALACLQDVHPAVMLLDVEMPRMDGYELATNVRNNPELQDIPIIMITSRTADKHRRRALDIGVDIYMGKPYNESDLLENISKLITT
jgi:chemosensory pili system protein ChpA (sensor histidine kinase/response regulator)